MKRLKILKRVTATAIILAILSAVSIAIIRSSSQQEEENHVKSERHE